MARRAGGKGSGVWRDLGGISRRVLPAVAVPWLAHDGSLTEKLARHFATEITVQPDFEGSAAFHRDETPLLPGPAARGHVREIALLAGGMPVVAARTVVPVDSRRLTARVRRLGTRPLAELLFAAGAPRCRVRQIARLRPDMPAHALAGRLSTEGPRWARRSLFEIAGECLLVTEIFLPPVIGTD